jgi:hypothetical protein
MMGDAAQLGQGPGGGGSGDLWTLPDIVWVDTERVTYDPPRRHVAGGQVLQMREGVEVTIQTDGPIPVRALAPQLHIGDAVLTESEPAGHLRYRFVGYDVDSLKDGENISLGWSMARSPLKVSQFRYHVDRTVKK